MRGLFVFLLFVLFQFNIFGQNKIDSLSIYYAQGQYYKVIDLSKSKLNRNHLRTLNDSIAFVTDMSYMGLAYLELDEYDKAEDRLKTALSRAERFQNIHRIIIAGPISNLGMLYYKKDQLELAQNYFLQALHIINSELGKSSVQYLTIIGNLAGVYNDLNQFAEAEKYYIEAVEGTKNILGVKDYSYGLALNNLGTFYIDIGSYKKAYDVFVKAFSVISTDHPNYLTLLNNYAICLESLGNKTGAEKYYLQVIEKIREIKEFPGTYALALNNLGDLYISEKKYTKAEPLILEALKVKKGYFGENSLTYAITLGNLGFLYSSLGKSDDAEVTYRKTMAILEALSYTESEYYNGIIDNLALLYFDKNAFEKASQLFLRSTKWNHYKYVESLKYLSQDEAVIFKNINQNNHNLFLTFINDYKHQDSLLLSTYNTEILLKNMSLRNQQRIRNGIKSSGNLALAEEYDNYILNKRFIAGQDIIPKEKRSVSYDSVVDETENLEKKITRLSSEFSEQQEMLSVSFNDIVGKLKPDEAVIDLVNYQYYNKKWTDSIFYNAFVIRKNKSFPEFTFLFEEQQIDSILSNKDYSSIDERINRQYKRLKIDSLFQYITKKIEGVKTLYIVPSGLGHQINFTAIPVDSSQTLGDKYKVHIIGSSADILKYSNTFISQKNNSELILYGDIDYDLTNENRVLIDTLNSDNTDVVNSLATRSGIDSWNYLPGTAEEVSNIKRMSEAAGFQNEIFNGKYATKKSVIDLDGRNTPFVLHLATHGFFFENPKQRLSNDDQLKPVKIDDAQRHSYLYEASNDPMLRSGLIFSGANKYWGKTFDKKIVDNGILTAKEISNLDLSSCELVVLSACETGLGDIKGSEGVYGLQRAFKMAGVKNIIMSLWKVPDAQTAELFDLFYGFCLEGKSIHAALRLAQAEMKLKYTPYYWAGFVLLE